jgi:hypothetical protein
MNIDDPFVTFECEHEPARVSAATRAIACSDGTVPFGRLDVRRALLVGDAHAVGVCVARRYLRDHLDDAGRSAFQAEFAECDLSASPPVTRAQSPP